MPPKRKRLDPSAQSVTSSPTSTSIPNGAMRVTRAANKAAEAVQSMFIASSPPRKVSKPEWRESLTDIDLLPSDDFEAELRLIPSQELKAPVVIPAGPPSPAPSSVLKGGRAGWKQDVEKCMALWGRSGDVDGFAGLLGTVRGFIRGESDDSVKFVISAEDLDGNDVRVSLDAVFDDLSSYPADYTILLFSSESLPRRIQRIIERFSSISDLDVMSLITRLIYALQGDDEATGDRRAAKTEQGVARQMDPDDDEEGGSDDDGEVGWEAPGRGLEIAKGSFEDLGRDWGRLKERFSQAKSMGYRSGLTRISDSWVISYSIPLKNLPIDPNMLAMWDDGLVEAWKQDKRFTLLIGTDSYPPRYETMKYWLTFHTNYKPPETDILAITRGKPSGFFLSASLVMQLRSYPRCWSLRTAYGLNWDTADRFGLCERLSADVFHNGVVPFLVGEEEKSDPVAKSFENNLELCAFYWVLRRFVEASKYCQLPKVLEIKKMLDDGGCLKDLTAPPGSLGVLRWVVGSCRAYLKEAKPGEGVLNAKLKNTYGYYGFGSDTGTALRQFTFVVGSPQQETSFKEEIRLARASNPNCEKFSTLLAYHGSGAERWHNILRAGLDFQEIACGRAYGNGVYFAPDVETSMGSYARINATPRPNADFPITRATALVELVNVPNKFVSRSPYYVVANTKQIKPFLLLVEGKGESIPELPTHGKLFQHDPTLHLKTTFGGQPVQVKMPEQLVRTTYIDDDDDDEEDQKIHAPPLPTKPAFTPSAKSRFIKLERMPPPRETSVVASRVLGKELKSLVKLQEEGKLPFYLDPEGDSLYCWVMELWEWPESELRGDMEKVGVNSIVAEMRFPASFPHSPPFMRILHPRFLPFAQGGGGNITAGGSVCNEILTATGWNPAFCVEAIVRDIMTNMTDATPPARLDLREWDRGYSVSEAVEAYKRVAAQHGWEVPRDFYKISGRR